MRTTLNLDDNLLEDAKKIAAEKRTTLAKVVEDALRIGLAKRKGIVKKPPSLPAFGQGGLRDGIDLDSTSDLMELMEKN